LRRTVSEARQFSDNAVLRDHFFEQVLAKL
jgi:hypothetical protein